MTVDEVAKLVDAAAKLVSAFAWPLVVGAIILRVAPELRQFFENLGEFSLKAAGVEASAKRSQVASAASLAAAAAAHPESEEAGPNSGARAAVDIVTEMATPAALRRAENATVLWVDDRPDNNVYERQSLEALGVTFVLATSTDEALDKLKRRHFDVIVSDMGRAPDARAGYTLLDALRGSGDKTPFIIYAGSNAPEHKAEAQKHGALGSTNRPVELFEYVMRALRRTT